MELILKIGQNSINISIKELLSKIKLQYEDPRCANIAGESINVGVNNLCNQYVANMEIDLSFFQLAGNKILYRQKFLLAFVQSKIFGQHPYLLPFVMVVDSPQFISILFRISPWYPYSFHNSCDFWLRQLTCTILLCLPMR